MLWHDFVWWIALIAALPVWLLQNVMHELMHGLAILPWGWRFKIWPFPGRINGRFYFAYVEYLNVNNITIPGYGWVAVHLMPKIYNLMVLLVGTLLFLFVPFGAVGHTIITTLIIAQLIDFTTGMVALFRSSEPDSLTDVGASYYLLLVPPLWAWRVAALFCVSLFVLMLLLPLWR